MLSIYLHAQNVEKGKANELCGKMYIADTYDRTNGAIVDEIYFFGNENYVRQFSY